jgi:hypothetical protein|tara:strand:+ start:216 stop:551 length:336 start_codon:yes stop_codon:yes gene_type:complete
MTTSAWGLFEYVRKSYRYIDPGEYVPTAITPRSSEYAMALTNPFCPSLDRRVLPNLSIGGLCSRPGRLMSKMCNILEENNYPEAMLITSDDERLEIIELQRGNIGLKIDAF